MPSYALCCEARYRTREGDTALSIARALGVGAAALVELNPSITGPEAEVGEGHILSVPVPHRYGGALVALSDRHNDPGIVLFRVQDGSSVEINVGPCSWGSSPTLSPDGSRLAFQDADGRLAVTAIPSGDSQHVSDPLPNPIQPRWSPGGDCIMYESDGAIVIVRADPWERVGRHNGRLGSWLGDGYRIVYVHEDAVKCRDLASGAVDDIDAGADKVWSTAGSPRGSEVAVVASDRGSTVIRVIDTFTGDRSDHGVSAQVWPWTLAWSPDGRRLAYCVGGGTVSGGQETTVVVVDSGLKEPVETLVVTDPRFGGLSWDPDSEAVAIAARIGKTGAYGVYAIEPGYGAYQLTGTGNCVLPDWGPAVRGENT